MIEPPLLPEHREMTLGVFRELLRQRPWGAGESRPEFHAVVERAVGAFESAPFTLPPPAGSLAVQMQALLVRVQGRMRLEDAIQERRLLRVADLLRQLQACTLTERGIWIGLSVDEALHVEADEVLLSCALGNLLHNAVRFSRNGAHVGLACYGEPGGVIIEVEDECRGFPAEARVPGGPLVSGTAPAWSQGEGLTLTQRIATAMSGSLELGAPGEEGCAFALSLDAARSRTSSVPPPSR